VISGRCQRWWVGFCIGYGAGVDWLITGAGKGEGVSKNVQGPMTKFQRNGPLQSPSRRLVGTVCVFDRMGGAGGGTTTGGRIPHESRSIKVNQGQSRSIKAVDFYRRAYDEEQRNDLDKAL
jgi:hypothetical protein